jgi:hypothetical protein
MQVDPPQRFIGINVADSRGDLLIQQDALDARSSGSDRADNGVLIELGVQQIASDVSHRDREAPCNVVIDHGGEGQPAKGALIHKSQLPARVRECDPNTQMLLVECVSRLHQQLTTHAQVAHDRMVIIKTKPQVLASS